MNPRDEEATVVGLLDGLIDQGVHVAGDLVIGLADVDLIRVALRLLVASEDTYQRTAIGGPSPGSAPRMPAPRGARGNAPTVPASAGVDAPLATPPDALPSTPSGRDVTTEDRERLARGVSQLVLTVVEVIRELLERQAIRRVDAGTLTDDQVERLGLALAALEERMAEVREVFGLRDEDLNLDLGPLGRLR